MPYPFDGTPNLRPGAEVEVRSLAPRFEPSLPLEELFLEFLADSASIIGLATEKT